MQRYCYLCKELKADGLFSPSNKETRRGELKGKCKSCISASNKKYRENNKEELRAYEKKRRLDPERVDQDRRRSYKRRYGITEEHYLKMREEQGYRCAICGMHEEEHRDKWNGHLHIDHCHATGEVRALLCGGCNRGLGCFNDNVDKIIMAKEYLEKYKNLTK